MKILILCLLLTSCASVKVTAEKCTSEFVCTKISYWSKKDHKDGVTVKYGDLEFTSNSSVSKDSVIETSVAGGITEIFSKLGVVK